MTYILDTDICSYAIRKYETVVKNIILHEHDSLFISSISYAELLFGAQRKKSAKLLHAVRKFLECLHVVDFDTKCAEEYAAIRTYLEAKGSPVGNMDMLIAATAKSANAIIVTNNIKHYQGIPKLVMENWAN
ncbi:ribonuclease VapC [Spirochaetia bacterium]|nr:ribonuclease VapC [Spirochaetia bacterium]